MSNHVCSGAVVKGLLARADKPTPGDAVFFFFFALFFSVWSLFSTLFFLLACCFLFLLLTLLILYLDRYIF